MIDRGRHNILGVKVHAVDYSAAVGKILEAAHARRPMAVSALAVHGVMTGVLDRTHRYRLNHFDLLVPDGQPVRWALNRLHQTSLTDRVYGPELMLRVCQRAADEDQPIFLFGGSDELLDRLVANLTALFPRLKIAGTRSSRFRCLEPNERDALVEEIRASGAAITFVGLGCPRQEVFTYEMREALGMPVLAVGAAFNFHAGLLPQAPQAMQARGLEWLFRLFKEPRRLWRRYLLLNPLYLALLALQWSRLRVLDPGKATVPAEEVRYG